MTTEQPPAGYQCTMGMVMPSLHLVWCPWSWKRESAACWGIRAGNQLGFRRNTATALRATGKQINKETITVLSALLQRPMGSELSTDSSPLSPQMLQTCLSSFAESWAMCKHRKKFYKWRKRKPKAEHLWSENILTITLLTVRVDFYNYHGSQLIKSTQKTTACLHE